MQINLIWAQARQRVIGHQGVMPWHLPEDLAHFKALTLGHPVVMGRKTWDSLPVRFRPLPGRTSVVITRQQNWQQNGVESAVSLPNALQICEQIKSSEGAQTAEVWVIGGAQIYAQALTLAQRVEVTEIDAAIEGDAFAPALDAAWLETAREKHVSKTGLSYSFVTYIRH
jgi:dihydrofolate reductase